MTTGRAIAMTWIALMLSGFASLSLAGNFESERWAFAAIIAVAAAKAMLVVWVYMHIGAAPRGWRIAFAALICTIAAAIVTLRLAA